MSDRMQPLEGSIRVDPADADEHRVHVVVHRPPTTGWRARFPWMRAFEAGAIAAVLSVGLSAFALWHQSAYVPSTLPADLSVSVELSDPVDVPGSRNLGDLRQFEATIHVKNAGSRRVTVLAGQYALWGAKLVQRDQAQFDATLVKEQGLCSSPFGGRYVKQADGPGTLLATGRLLDATWLDAGQETDERVLLFARASDVDVAAMTVVLSVAKGDVIQTDERPTSWTRGELDGNTANRCQSDLEGDLTTAPIYWTYWRVENRTPILGWFLPDQRRFAVEWRPAMMVGHLRSSGADCDPQTASDNATAADPCELSERLSSTGTASFIDPTIAYCTKSTEPSSCHLTSTLPLKTLFDLEHELGLASSWATAYTLMWPQSPDGAAGG